MYMSVGKKTMTRKKHLKNNATNKSTEKIHELVAVVNTFVVRALVHDFLYEKSL